MSRGKAFQAEGVTSTKALKWEKGLDSPVEQQVGGGWVSAVLVGKDFGLCYE